jgi:hypothetical protein
MRYMATLTFNLKRNSFLFFRILSLILFACMIDASEIPEKPNLVIPGTPADSIFIIAGEPYMPALNPPRSQLFNECAYCDAGRAEWHYDINVLKHMAYECGFDYVILRFDRIYRFQNLTVKAAYFFSATSQALRFDSAVVRYAVGDGNKTLFFPCTSCHAAEGVTPVLLDTSFAAKLSIIDRAEAFSRSFSSAMVAKDPGKGLRIAFSFGMAGMSFVMDEQSGLNRYEFTMPVRGADTGAAAYKLAWFFSPARVASESRDIGAGPAIKDVSLSYDNLQQLVVTFTATSGYGLREAVFSSNEYSESMYFKGSKREGITKTLKIDSSHSSLSIKVYDLHGNSATAYYFIFEEKREHGRQEQAHRKRLEKERIWADKNPVNKIIYTLGQFDGNIGWWIKAISQGLIGQDIAADSLRDMRMKEALKPRSTDTAAPADTPEVIGE